MTTQPQFADGPPVPLMVEGLIDAATLRQLQADLTEHTQVLLVREKQGRTQNASQDDITLASAIDRLIARQAPAVQVRYRYSDHDWVDTIFALPGGYRVVRCQYDEKPS